MRENKNEEEFIEKKETTIVKNNKLKNSLHQQEVLMHPVKGSVPSTLIFVNRIVLVVVCLISPGEIPIAMNVLDATIVV